jgi:hypothetical protein
MGDLSTEQAGVYITALMASPILLIGYAWCAAYFLPDLLALIGFWIVVSAAGYGYEQMCLCLWSSTFTGDSGNRRKAR